MSFQSSHAAAAASSSSKSWNYDIFVSFRGADTRNTFVDHFYAALDERRITYLNQDKVPRGELMGPLLLKAIKESQIVIVVFSKNYADSFWCLNELVYIMKCMEEKGQIVIPIFYDVDASYVRTQKGTYEESFARHERHNKDTVESWRKALVDATNICGWDLKYDANGYEAKFIKQVVGMISNRLFGNKDLIGIKSHLQDVKYDAQSCIDSNSKEINISRSPPHSTDTSSETCKHDVFLNFKGGDTRKTFVDHLYAALDKQGIYAYKQRETSTHSESVNSSLQKAIKESKIAVIVFSKNYADSSSCLDELIYIMECKEERGQIVMPIFYDVDPWEVQTQKWKYEEAFAKHELENNKKVESWKKALVDATKLSGWVTKYITNGREAGCVKQVVDTISKRLFPTKDFGTLTSFHEDLEYLKIPLEEILLATNTFAKENIIAGGGFGKVYQGQSKKHGIIAVKQLDRRNGQGDREFMMEIALLSTYKHENIVSLVGYCDQGGEKILVYKYEKNGSLDKLIHSKNLTWIQRLQICIDAARGLSYLHDDVGPQHRILHRDIKSANILLDENLKAKISDFGLSKIALANVPCTVVISNPCGTIGYLDPQYLRGILTQKSDVYSFGVVLFEVLCGRLASIEEHPDERHFSVQLAQNHFKKNTLDEIIDSDLRNQMKLASLSTFSKVAYDCLKEHGEERPTMNKVAQELKKALDHQLVV